MVAGEGFREPMPPRGASVCIRRDRILPTQEMRLKGWLRTDAHGWCEIQFAGKHGSLRPAVAPAAGAALVAIGLRGDRSPTVLESMFCATEEVR